MRKKKKINQPTFVQKKETKGKAAKKKNPNSSPSLGKKIDHILQLQQTLGNQAVQRMIKSGTLQLKDVRMQKGDTYPGEIEALAQRVLTSNVETLLQAQQGDKKVSTGRSVIQKGKKKKGAVGSQEEAVKNELVEKGWQEGKIEIGGAGKSGADITAYDEINLWIIEVKGRENWLSVYNLNHEGNAPAKQLVTKLQGSIKKTTLAEYAGSDEELITTIGDYLLDHGRYWDGRKNILLAVTNTKLDDALLAIPYKTTGKERQYVFLGGKQIPLSVDKVFEYLNYAVEVNQQFEKGYGRMIKTLENTWKKWTEDARSFFIYYPEHLGALENAYTAARRMVPHELRGSTELKTIGEEINYIFLPVVKKLPRL